MRLNQYAVKRCINIIKYGDDLFKETEGFINRWNLVQYIGTDEDEQGTVYMFQGPNVWYDFRKVGGRYMLVDYGLCSDWSKAE